MLLNMEDDAIVSAQDRAGAYEPCARALRLEIPRSRCLGLAARIPRTGSRGSNRRLRVRRPWNIHLYCNYNNREALFFEGAASHFYTNTDFISYHHDSDLRQYHTIPPLNSYP
jgi:hypothetical protein